MSGGAIAFQVFRLVLILFLAYVAWHIWVAYGLHQTPDQFLEGVRHWLRGIGPSLMPDLWGAIR